LRVVPISISRGLYWSIYWNNPLSSLSCIQNCKRFAWNWLINLTRIYIELMIYSIFQFIAIVAYMHILKILSRSFWWNYWNERIVTGNESIRWEYKVSWEGTLVKVDDGRCLVIEGDMTNSSKLLRSNESSYWRHWEVFSVANGVPIASIEPAILKLLKSHIIIVQQQNTKHHFIEQCA
jgi:hypothetical protein